MSSALWLAQLVSSAWISAAPSSGAPATQDRVRVGIAPLSFTGKGEGAEAIDGKLSEVLVDHETDAIRLERRCEDDPCRAEQAKAAGVDYVLEADVRGELNDYRMKLALHDATGRRVQVVEFACEICTPDDAAQRIIEQAKALREHMSAGAGEEPSTDAQAASGPAVALRPTGGPVGVDTPAQGHDDRAARKHRTLRIAGWSTASIGVVGVVAGAVLLVLDERPYRARCTGAGRDINGECEFLYDTLPGGAASLAIGGAALVTGITLAVIGHRRGRTSRAHARVGPGSVGMEVRF